MAATLDDLRALRRVPPALEAWWLREARRATGLDDEDAALERLEAAVAHLSEGFTSERPERFDDYGRDPVLRAAYALCFGAQSWVRARLPLAEAAAVRGWSPPAGRRLSVLDVGAGSGAAGLSAATWLGARHGAEVELLALDRSTGALAALARCAAEVAPPPLGPAVATLVSDARAPDAWPQPARGPFDLVVASCVGNELFAPPEESAAAAWLLAVARRLAPDGLLLLIEPAPKPFAERVVRLAADAVERGGLFAWGPQSCAGAWRPAPDARTWPHEVRAWDLPASLARLNRRLWRSLHELTFSYALLGRRAPPALAATAALWRLASPVRRLRGRLGWLGYDGLGALREYEVQERDLPRGARARLLDAERGDLLEARALRELDGGRRLRLLGPDPLRRHVRPEGESPVSAP